MECIIVFKLHSYKYYRQLRHIWYTYDSHIKDNTYMYDNHMWLNCLCMTNLDRNQFINWKIIQILFEHWSPDSFFQMKHLRSLVIQKQLTHYLNSYIASFKECTFQFPWVKMIFYHQRVDKKNARRLSCRCHFHRGPTLWRSHPPVVSFPPCLRQLLVRFELVFSFWVCIELLFFLQYRIF